MRRSPDALIEVLGGMLAGIEVENVESYAKAADTEAMQSAVEAVNRNDPDKFYFALTYPFQRNIEGLFAKEFSDTTHEFRFLFQHVRFVEMQFRRLIEKIEGSACCADKTRTIVRSLAAFLRDGKPIVFNYNQEYTYHLPTKVFTSHDEIAGFFKAVQQLYYGRYEPYVKALAAVHAKAAERDESGPETDA